jgi:tetratricopeptide (TPR) repeat protein
METRAEAPTGGRAAAEAFLESGEAAIAAGAFDRGLGELRDAAASASASGETAVEAAALLGWGSALVHGAKGRDEDGSAALHRAMRAAESVGDRRTAAAAQRELGYVELLRGEYARSTVWLKRAATFADGDPLELSWIHAVMGAGLSDTGKHEQATTAFDTAIELATEVDHGRALAWTLTCLGRAQLLRGELEAAQDTLSTARERTRAEHWTAFLSFPEALLGEVWIRRGDLDAAAALFEHAFTLGCSVDDACWEAYSVRGIGLLDASRGDLDGAIARLEDALARCLRQRDTHTWIRAYVLDALCATSTAAKDARADGWVTELGALAGRCGMREFQVHAYLYRADLGDLDALEAARALAGGVENPLLQGVLDAAGPPMLEVLLGA